jgi:hypothetical protein
MGVTATGPKALLRPIAGSIELLDISDIAGSAYDGAIAVAPNGTLAGSIIQADADERHRHQQLRTRQVAFRIFARLR